MARKLGLADASSEQLHAMDYLAYAYLQTGQDAKAEQVLADLGAIRQAVSEAAGYEGVEHAVTLKKAFAETETFWKKREKPDAMKWAAEARTHAESLEQAISSRKWDEAKAALTGLQQTCSACHGVYRQRLDDGSYRIK